MKHATIIAASTLLSLSALASPHSFTGTFDVKVTAPKGGSGGARFHVAGGAVASEVDMGGEQKSLMRLKTRTLTKDGVFMLIDDASKSYREVSVETMRNYMRRPANETWKIERVGRETVAGFQAEHVRAVSSRGALIELWMSNAVTRDANVARAFTDHAKMSTGLVDALERNGAGGIPMKLVTASPDGDIAMEVVSVKREAPPAVLFAVPDGYAKVVN